MNRDRDPQRYQRMLSLFGAALEVPPEQWSTFLATHCADDALRAEVLDLLTRNRQTTDDRLLAAPHTAMAEILDDALPDRIGAYRPIRVLGSGGMGKVYLAEQHEPIARQVAIKVIKLGMDSEAIVARFQRERQTLALMQHDGIAKMFDCGTTERGQPYFVMEYVEGVPLTEFCDRERLSIEQRVALLQAVCDAVTHAHQKGVVHRDLKPDNILVARQGNRATCKVIDFGLARLLTGRDRQQSMLSTAGQAVGTPEYMAPEQADPGNADVDTRADVYALGAILYELCCGSRPFVGLRSLPEAEMWRTLREVEPQRPSVRLRGAPAEVLEARRTTASALGRALREDLDWIVGKAIERDRERRYQAVGDLAADLQRYLAHQPISAGPPSTVYRLRKFARRYRTALRAAAAVAGTALVGGVIAAMYATEGKAARQDLARTSTDLLTYAASGQLARLIASAREMESPTTEHLLRLVDWLDEHERVSAFITDVGERRLRDLRAGRARVTNGSGRGSPLLQQLERESARLRSMQRADRIRRGIESLAVPTLPAELTADPLNPAWFLAVDRTSLTPESRVIFGEEALGLACAQYFAARELPPPEAAKVQWGLACAWFENGQDVAAMEAAHRAIESMPQEPKYRENEAQL